jgi:hypothetical protein
MESRGERGGGGGFWTRPQRGGRGNGRGADSGKGPKIGEHSPDSRSPKIPQLSFILVTWNRPATGRKPVPKAFQRGFAGGRPGTRGLKKESRVRFRRPPGRARPGTQRISEESRVRFPGARSGQGGGGCFADRRPARGGGCFADASRPPPRKPGIPGIPPWEPGECARNAGDHGLPRDPGIHLKTGGIVGSGGIPGTPRKPRGFTEFLLVEIRFSDQ